MVQDIHRGLINNLIRNARNGRTTKLDTQVMSLRDDVFSRDIGRDIGHRIELRNRSNAGRICFLVSSRCSSIFEVAQKIRKSLNLNVYYTLDDRFGNTSDITFHASVMPPDWQPATLDYGIGQFAVQN